MDSIIRENLQRFLHVYKENKPQRSVSESSLIYDASVVHQKMKLEKRRKAIDALKWVAMKCKVAFMVRCNVDYDGALEDSSPLYKKTISFKSNQFLHIYLKFDEDWWIGRIVEKNSRIGFIPTAKRLTRSGDYVTDDFLDEDSQNLGKSSRKEDIQRPQRQKTTIKFDIARGRQYIKSLNRADAKKRAKKIMKYLPAWEPPQYYTVVPSTRPIVILGPTSQKSRLTQLLHAALQDEIVKHFSSRIRRLTTNIGEKGDVIMGYDVNENEVRVITMLAESLHLVLLNAPNISTPQDLDGIFLAPIYILIRIRDRKILLHLLRKTSTKKAGELTFAETLNSLPENTIDLIIEENGLDEASRKVCRYLENYWEALHPTWDLIEQDIEDFE